MRHTPSRICSACDAENIGFKNRCVKCNSVLDANNFKGQSKKAKIRENRKIIREQSKVKKRRKITPFEKELRDLAGERIKPRISKHAIIRFKQRLSITNQELVEKYVKICEENGVDVNSDIAVSLLRNYVRGNMKRTTTKTNSGSNSLVKRSTESK